MSDHKKASVIWDSEIKNAKTGIDLSVPNFWIDSEITFYLVVKTNFPEIVTSFENSATGKMFEKGKTIRLMQNRKYKEFRELRRELCEKFAEVPILSTENEAQIQQKSADKLMKWCASTPEIAVSKILLKFLASPQKDPTMSGKIRSSS